MITRLTTVDELKSIFAEILLNKTNKISKISDNSVVNGVSFGVAKVAQKALKDQALVESHLFPDSAFGQYLDQVGANNGIAPRFGASQSSTYLRLVAEVGTEYLQGTHTFTGSHNIVFDLEEDITIGDEGFAYAKVRSQGVGANTNVDPLTINQISPTPNGHEYVINEYTAVGGRDQEDDNLFRRRIKEGPNLLATATLSSIEQAFMKINSNVMRVYYQGINSSSQTVIAIATQNGINLTNEELDELIDKGEQFFALTDIRSYGSTVSGVFLRNIQWQPIDISFRVELFPSYNPDDVRKNIQIKMQKELDYRFWNAGDKVEWDNLLSIAKNTSGVKYVPDNFFFPNQDQAVDSNKLPRIRGFLMLDLDGNILANLTGTLSPIYYPQDADFSYQQTALRSIS